MNVMSLIWNKSYFPTVIDWSKWFRTKLEIPSLQLSRAVFHKTCAKKESQTNFCVTRYPTDKNMYTSTQCNLENILTKETKRQLVRYGIYYSTANWQAKIPAIFRCIFGIILCILKHLVIYSTIYWRNLKIFSGNLVEKYWSRETEGKNKNPFRVSCNST